MMALRQGRYRTIWPVALILIAVALTGAPAHVHAQSHKPHKVVKYDFPFYRNYEAGLAAAKASGKPILLDFYFDT